MAARRPRQPLRLPTPDRLARLVAECPDLPRQISVLGVDPGPSGGAWACLRIGEGGASVSEWAEWWTTRDTMQVLEVRQGDAWDHGRVDHDRLARELSTRGRVYAAGVELPYVSGRRTSLVDTIESAGAWRLAVGGLVPHLHRPLPQEWRGYLGVLRSSPRARQIDRRVVRATRALLADPLRSPHGTPEAPALTSRGRAARHVWDALGVAWYAAACHVVRYVAGSWEA